ncbi:hypothetical protein MICPUN_107704 [Micromonas commoda]|uniref:GATA-type domain-containing protein n=1 Tax=Micromonas commoda (strain RCC299 / NOUM17 / CCMP2709) TaxID=296587 RepID=C1DYD9_MICCC|nr:hypothetical protein MICPUN_107704 [Micromonas commoda]ACO60929.1 hypothetical protein MICPUN_107704 [Micromonas commoda]|eukprot:XP_002499671.1 hypothetical protein MICPUN_107704 [Micromonas commoda]
MAEGPLAWLHPFDSGLHSFPSLDAGTDLLGLPPSNCGVAAKMAFSELAAMDLLRTPSGFDTRAADAQPPETSRRVTGADATSAGEKPFAFDAQRAHAGAPSTSYVPSEVFSPVNFGDVDVADALFTKGPLRTLSARTFDALLNDTSPRENEEWTALQNLPSLPRDLTTVDLGVGCDPDDDDASCAPVAFGDDRPDDVALMDNGDEDGVRLARARAATARARAKEARSIATQKTATATALTIQAKEMLNAAATVGDADRDPAGVASGLRTPTAMSERGTYWGGYFEGFDATTALSGDAVSSPAAVGTCGTTAEHVPTAEVRSSSRRSTKRDAPFDGPNASDDEESTPSRGGGGSSAKRRRKGEANGVIQVNPRPMATDSIITASGKKMKRGCLNCGQQKTPQWRMGPEGPKTLCNACGVRFRKGLPLDGP